ncbi:MAG TPA: helix-turn-helix domain-containing protein, partial [Virgibacillus sp.]|nr:helix-turn-helix domain-containing protein [Virgibacillus sp.]
INENEYHAFQEASLNQNKIAEAYYTTTSQKITFKIYPLKSGIYFIGYLLVCLIKNNPLHEQAINSAINALLLDATKNHAINQYLKNQDIALLEDIIKGNTEEIKEEKLSFPVKSTKQLLLWETEDQLDMEKKFLIMDSILREEFDIYFLWIFENHIIGLMTKPIDSSMIENLQENIPKGYISLSGVIKDYATIKIRKLYEQALIAMKYAKAKEKKIVAWNDMSFNRISYFLNDQLIFEDYGELITPLIEKDQTDGTNLVQTLYVYLKSFFSYTKAAKTLFIHPNTVKYRIDQIQHLLGDVELRDHQTYLDLMMAIKLYMASKRE